MTTVTLHEYAETREPFDDVVGCLAEIAEAHGYTPKEEVVTVSLDLIEVVRQSLDFLDSDDLATMSSEIDGILDMEPPAIEAITRTLEAQR